MSALKTLDSSIISLIVLTIILIHSYSRLERVFVQYKLFASLLMLNMSLIVIDILGWAFNGLPGGFNLLLNTGFNLLLYIIVPLAPSVWVLYTYYLAESDKRRIRNARNILISIVAVNAALSVISLFNGWFFSIDADNIYHRGPLFLFHAGISGALILYSLLFIIANRKRFQKKLYYSLLVFFVPQIIGTTIQIAHYGVSYNWSGMMLSMIIIYFNFQSRNLNTDFLTGANNRLHFHGYINAKIRGVSDKKTFGAIMIDIDNFKKINDNYGHETGDEALKDTVRILRECLSRDDFIARFGGDEFIVVISVQTIGMLEVTVRKIRDRTELFNAGSAKPYRLNFSMGYDIYDAAEKIEPDKFIAHLDQLMYKDKYSRKQSGPANQ